jgi:hypothetical protein
MHMDKRRTKRHTHLVTDSEHFSEVSRYHGFGQSEQAARDSRQGAPVLPGKAHRLLYP